MQDSIVQNNNTIEKALKNRRSNNLNVIKFIAAICVIIAHSYPFSLGKGNGDFVSKITDGNMDLGKLAVCIFFISSGLLITKSIDGKKTAKEFFRARCVRIFPSLFLIVFLSVFILGPLFSKNSLLNYFTDTKTYLYLLNGALIPVHNLPGVFQNNIFDSTINGALWTLPVEFICYIGAFIAFKLGFFEKRRFLLTVPFILTSFFLVYYSEVSPLVLLKSYLYPVYMFYIGVGFYIFKDKIALRNDIALISFILFGISIMFGQPFIGLLFFFPYPFFTIAFNQKQCSNKLAKLGLLSYGIYLSGSPIQQMLVELSGGRMVVYQNMILATFLAIVAGFIVFRVTKKIS